MSLVGTRPILQDELRQYELHHRARIAIKPGMPQPSIILDNGFIHRFRLGSFTVYVFELIMIVNRFLLHSA